jgi:phosphatidylcholine synthase
MTCWRGWRWCLAWCVHAYTALGLVAAGAIAVLLIVGGPESYRRVFLLMVFTVLIDATDGTFARWVRVKEVLPSFDGRRLDDLIDFLNYTCLPLLLVLRVPLLPDGWSIVLLLPLLASAYGFCQTSAKTDDGYFLGFPSYWNVTAFYLYALQPLPLWLTLSVLVVLALLTFVPSRYLYPTQRGRLNRFTTLLGTVWALLLIWIIWKLPASGGRQPPVGESEDVPTRRLAELSLFFPAWYLAASWVISVRLWRGKRRVRRERRRPVLW